MWKKAAQYFYDAFIKENKNDNTVYKYTKTGKDLPTLEERQMLKQDVNTLNMVC